jgi:CRP-like cAMP-binding protein
MMFYASELKESERKMTNLVHMTVKGRLAYTLLFLQEKFGVDEDGFIDIQLSRQDLASFAGTTYETTFRMFTEMQAEKAILLEKKQLRLLDFAKLNSYMVES